MVIALYAGKDSGLEMPSELKRQAGIIRDQSVLLYCTLYQESFHMEPCILQTIKELNLEIPSKERDEALSRLLPEYEQLLQAMKGVENSYLTSLFTNMASYGIITTR